MLTAKDIIFVTLKDTDGKDKIVEQEYDRVYFTHGKEDPLVSKSRKYNGVANVATIQEPANEQSTVDIATLWNEMCDFFDGKGPDPRIEILQLIDRAYDQVYRLNKKREIENANKPPSARRTGVNSLEELADNMVKMGLYPTVEDALSYLTTQKQMADTVKENSKSEKSQLASLGRQKLLINKGFTTL